MSDILQFILEAYVCKKDQARATRGPSSDQAYDWCQKKWQCCPMSRSPLPVLGLGLTVTKGAGYHRNDCELDIEDQAEKANEDQKKSQLSILDRTEELETEDTIVQQPRPETVTSSDEDATMETVSADQERMPVTPTNQKSTVLASTVQKSNAHKAQMMSPILSPISKGNYLDPWSSPDCCPDPSEIS